MNILNLLIIALMILSIIIISMSVIVIYINSKTTNNAQNNFAERLLFVEESFRKDRLEWINLLLKNTNVKKNELSKKNYVDSQIDIMQKLNEMDTNNKKYNDAVEAIIKAEKTQKK